MKIKYYACGDVYEVSEGTQRETVTVTNLTSGAKFLNNHTWASLAKSLLTGKIFIAGLSDKVEAKPAPASTDLEISVDSSELDKALATAKELEATMLRIKGLFV